MWHSSVGKIVLRNGAEFSFSEETYPCGTVPTLPLTCLSCQLLGMGAPINALNEKSVTALYTAVCSRQMETVSVLCLSRADLEVKDAEGKTALHHVCSNSSDIGIATLLVQSGADINSIDAFGHTPFEMAMAAGNVAMMKLMVESGTKPPGTRASKYVNKCRGVRGRKELWELMMAKGWGSPDTATTTIDAIRLRSVEAAPDVSSTAASSLHVSVKNGDVGAVAKILSTGGDPNALDARGRTPLHLAAELGHVEVVEELLKGKANMEIRDIISHTPLHSAVEAQRVAVIEVLIAGGASLGREDEQGKTPLHIACKLDYTDIISTLLDAGAIPSHRRNELLQSPLFVACEAGSIGAVRQLLPRLSVRQINIFDRVREEIKGGKPMLMGGDTALMAAVRSSRNQLEIVRAVGVHLPVASFCSNPTLYLLRIGQGRISLVCKPSISSFLMGSHPQATRRGRSYERPPNLPA